MANTKLSNTNGFEHAAESVPSRISSYITDVREEVAGKKEKSLYCSELSFVGMVGCLVVCVIGILLLALPDLASTFFAYGDRAADIWNVLIKIGGVFLLLAGIHEIGRMFFAKKIASCDKRIRKTEKQFQTQYAASAERYSVDQMRGMIETYGDAELPETDAADNKLVRILESLYARNDLMNRLTFVSRIVLPVILYGLALFVVFRMDDLKASGAAAAFALMIVFSRRLCLLLEYKTGKAVRGMMTIPILLYGVLLYFNAKDVFADMQFFSQKVSSALVVCLAQTLVLVLSVCVQDYYSEKKHLSEGIGKHKRWYISYCIAGHTCLLAAYTFVLASEMKDMQDLDSVANALLIGIVFGVVWRAISPIWPELIAKTTRKFWGAKYSLLVSAFVFVMAATISFLQGFAFTGYVLTAFAALVVSSWIAFAVMVHFWG